MTASNKPWNDQLAKPYRSSHPRLADFLVMIVCGTAAPEHAEVVQLHCRTRSTVELRREPDPVGVLSNVGVWLRCHSGFGFLIQWKKIGYVPTDTARVLELHWDKRALSVARGVVRNVYAPHGRDEAVVTVKIDFPRICE